MLSCIHSHLLNELWLKRVNWVDQTLGVLGFITCEVAHNLFCTADYVHFGTRWVMSDHDQARRHHFNNWNSKVFCFHRVDSHFRSAKKRENFRSWLIHVELDWVKNFQLFGKLFKICYNFFIVSSSACPNHRKSRASRQLINSLLPNMQLQLMIFFGPKLSKWHQYVLAGAVQWYLVHYVSCVTRRVNFSDCGRAPQFSDVVVRPTRICRVLIPKFAAKAIRLQ